MVNRYTHLEAQVASACFSGLALTRSQPMLAVPGRDAISPPMALKEWHKVSSNLAELSGKKLLAPASRLGESENCQVHADACQSASP